MPSPRVRTFASLLNRPQRVLGSHACAAASFSTTTSTLYAASREPTLYEILDVPVTASAAEIKKQFYSLSLRHHPDRNRDDPTASTRFARISSAYHVLSNSAKRTAYDHEHGIHANISSTHSTAQPGQHPMGSYSSYGANLHTQGASYAGSRPASGLSKRRGPFRGPPPSFYAHGGYGHTARTSPSGHQTSSSTSSSSGAAGSSREEDFTSFIDRNPVWHFNARGHYRTQTAEDARRRERRSRQRSAALNEQYLGSAGDFAMRFIVVCSILVGAGAMTGLTGWPTSDRSVKSGKSTQRKEE